MALSRVDENAVATAPLTEQRQQSDLLARAFLDILASTGDSDSGSLIGSHNPDDPIEQLLSDPSDSADSTIEPSIRPDIAAVAVLTARALESVPGLIKELRRGSPTMTIATPSADLVTLVAEVFKACALRSEPTIEGNKRHRFSRQIRSAFLCVRDGSESGHRPEKGNDTIASALHARRPLIGISPDPKRFLPRDLMRTSEHNLVLGSLDASAIALVIETVTGKPLEEPIGPHLIKFVEINDLQLAIRKHQTPRESIKRLCEIINGKDVFIEKGPALEELAGYGQAREWGLNLAADLAAYKRGGLQWSDLDNGLLLEGPPGVGKTQYARALARSAGVPIIATSVADWNRASYLSGTLQAMRSAFQQAKKLAPSILFIDELDGISDRARLQGDNVEYWSQIVNLLLQLLSGIEERPGVIVVGATNHADKIDPAIRRAGRLDRTITIERPKTSDLCAITRFYLKDDLTDANLLPLALAARGGTGADIEAWIRRARSRARREDRTLTIDDVLREIRGSRLDLPQNLKSVASIHEAGHIVVGAALKCYEPELVWLTPSGGLTNGQMTLSNDFTLRGLENAIATLLGGRAAERLLLGAEEVTIGSGLGLNSDLSRATQIAFDIELRFGFGQLGLVQLSEATREALLQDRTVLMAIKGRLDQCHQRAEAIVQLNCPAVLELAQDLKNQGYLEREQIWSILGRHNLGKCVAPSQGRPGDLDNPIC